MKKKRGKKNKHTNSTQIIKMNTQLITVLGVCGLSLLRVYACVCCFIFILFVDMCVRMPSSPGSIAGVPSSQALLGSLITAPPSVYVPDVIGALDVWIQKPKKKSQHVCVQAEQRQMWFTVAVAALHGSTGQAGACICLFVYLFFDFLVLYPNR